ncbi:MAG: DUF2235 domain-containing protein, partial [Rhizobiales bacterium]|nr:DUF2235 domain-containing protein [Hyphomicrobiales bacterium]
DSMSSVWRLLEWWPKNDRYKEWSARKSFLGRYFPLAEPRFIQPGAFIHQSVIDRMAAVPNYRPENLPERRSIVEMSSELG